jgi:hypothetical protein
MRAVLLARRNFKVMFLDYLSVGLVVAFSPVLLLVLQTFGRLESFFSVTNLAPGAVLFGFAMPALGSSMILARDRVRVDNTWSIIVKFLYLFQEILNKRIRNL